MKDTIMLSNLNGLHLSLICFVGGSGVVVRIEIAISCRIFEFYVLHTGNHTLPTYV